jgi:outer membrane lipoprotein SlyB
LFFLEIWNEVTWLLLQKMSNLHIGEGILYRKRRYRAKREVESMRMIAVILTGVMVFSLCGCMESGTEKGAGIGAVSGGVIGGVVGHNMGGHTAEGVAIGAIGGALLGGLIGNQSEKSSQQQPARVIVTCPNGHQVDVTGFPAGSDVRCPVCNAVFKI